MAPDHCKTFLERVETHLSVQLSSDGLIVVTLVASSVGTGKVSPLRERFLSLLLPDLDLLLFTTATELVLLEDTLVLVPGATVLGVAGLGHLKIFCR